MNSVPRALLVVYALLFTPAYIWAGFFGWAPYIYTSALLLAGLVPFIFWTIFRQASGRKGAKVYVPKSMHLALAISALALMVMTVFYNYVGGDRTDYAGRSLFTTNLGLLVNYSIWLVLGIAFGKALADEETSSRVAIMTSWIGLSVFYLTQFDSSIGGINFISDTSDKRSMYLLFADFYAISSILASSIVRSKASYIAIIVVSALVLFVLGSRAALFVFLISHMVVGFLVRSVSNKALLLVCVGALAALPLVVDLSAYAPTARMLVFFEKGFQADASFIGRMQLLYDGLSDIAESPVLGAYNAPVDKRANVTSYIHNIFSFWQIYGVAPFMIIVFLFIVAPIRIISSSLFGRNLSDVRPISVCIALLGTFVIIQVIAARAYVWHFPWLLVGLMSVHHRLALKGTGRETTY